MNVENLEAAFAAAFSNAIRVVGIEGFKRTSFFGSNARSVDDTEYKLAA